jgi:hypothetical protein
VAGAACNSRGRLELAAIGDRGRGGAFGLGPGFKQHSHIPGTHESPADVSVFRTAIESDQPVAVQTIYLKTVADFLRPFSKYLRAFRAFDFYFFVNHEMPLDFAPELAFARLKGLCRALLKRYSITATAAEVR